MGARAAVLGAALLLVSLAACASDPHRAPVSYVPISDFKPGDAPAAPTTSTSSSSSETSTTSAPLKTDDTKTGSVNVSTAMPGSTAAASAGPDDTSCYKKFANGCCGDSPHAGKMKGKKLVCSKGTVPAASCKGFGTSCEPR